MKTSLEHNKDIHCTENISGSWHYQWVAGPGRGTHQWFHIKMPQREGKMVSLNDTTGKENKEHQPLAPGSISI